MSNKKQTIPSTLDEIKDFISTQKNNNSNYIKSGTAAERVSLSVQLLEATFQPITPTTVAYVSGVHRSYIYKNTAIKSLIERYNSYNEDLKKNPPNNIEHKIELITYHLHMKLMEAYVHEYQLLKYQNACMEKKITSLKKELNITE